MRHRLVRWHKQYADDGLVIVEIDGGKVEALKVVRRCVAKKEVEHPILWDAENRNHQRYGVQAWPTAFLIGTEGKVVWEGNPARIIRRPKRLKWFKRMIESELQSVQPANENE